MKWKRITVQPGTDTKKRRGVAVTSGHHSCLCLFLSPLISAVYMAVFKPPARLAACTDLPQTKQVVCNEKQKSAVCQKTLDVALIWQKSPVCIGPVLHCLLCPTMQSAWAPTLEFVLFFAYVISILTSLLTIFESINQLCRFQILPVLQKLLNKSKKCFIFRIEKIH